METKWCGSCQKDKPLSEFSKNRSTKDGLQKSCKACKKEQSAKYYNRNKEKVIAKTRETKKRIKEQFREYKKGLECTQCGEDYEWCLEFHHLDPNEKDVSVGLMIKTHSWKSILAEISKCVVLCSNCHRKVHGGKIVLGP